MPVLRRGQNQTEARPTNGREGKIHVAQKVPEEFRATFNLLDGGMN